MSMCSAQNGSESAGTSGARVEQIWGETKFVIPHSWILQDDVAERIIFLVKLPGCTEDHIKVKVWNKRELFIHAACQFHHYKLQYKIPLGASLLCLPRFESQSEILTFRFKALNPVCVLCHTPPARSSVGTQNEFSSVVNGFELVQPRHSIIYDGNKALFEAHLEGCKDYSQINFRIANNKVFIQARISPQHYYYLDLWLESSTKCEWKAYFDPKLEIFTCTIPLLGHYECGKCMAKRHLGAGGTCKEKVVGPQTAKASSGNPGHTHGQKIQQSPSNETDTYEMENVNLSFDFTYVTGQKSSHLKVAPYSETAV